MTIKRPKSKAQARRTGSPKFNAELIDVFYLIHSDPDLPTGAVDIALEIARPMNGRGQCSWPSLETISKGCKMGKTSVINAIKKMVENGHLTAEGGSAGRGHSTRYRFAMVDVKGSPADLLDGEKLALKGPVADLNKKQRKNSKKEAAEGGGLTAVPPRVDHPVSSSPVDALVPEPRETFPVAETVDDAPIAPALVADYAEAKASKTMLHKTIRDPAVAGRMHHHDKHPLQAPRFKNPGRGVVIDNDSGTIIGTFDDLPQKSQPPPKARARTYAEAIFGVAS
jgi:helix-turn-helix protein